MAVSLLSFQQERRNGTLPFGAAESEAVGQLPAERIPESRLLFFRQCKELIVVVLHFLVFFGDVGAVTVITVLTPAAATTTATTSTATSASATLLKLARLDLVVEWDLRLRITLPLAISSGLASGIGCRRKCHG